MRSIASSATAALTLAALGLAAGCDRETTAAAKQDAREAASRIEGALDRTGDKLAAAGERLQPKIEAAGERIADAAGAVTTTVKSGARTSAEATGIDAGAAREALGDAAITAAVKAGFLQEPGLGALAIDVDTRDGVVTLNGHADTAAARARAEQLAAATRGVRQVRNNLAVKQG